MKEKYLRQPNIQRIIDGIFLFMFIVFIIFVRIEKGMPYLFGYDALIASVLVLNHLAAIFSKSDEGSDVGMKVLLFVVIVTTGIDLIKYHTAPFFIHIYLYALFSVKYITNRKLSLFHWIYCTLVIGIAIFANMDGLYKIYYIFHFVILRVGLTVVGLYVKQVENELYSRYLEQFMLIENAGESFSIYRLIKDKDDKILDAEILNVNKAFEKLSGIKKETIIGKRVAEAFSYAELPWLDLVSKVYNSKKSFNEMRFITTVQKYIDLNIYYIDQNHIALLMNDVTDGIEKERKMKTILDRFEKANELKSQFLKDVNHRLRNPLNGMMGMMQLVTYDEVGEDNRELLNSALLEMRHVRNILNQITKYVEIQGMDFDFTKEDCREIIGKVVASVESNETNIVIKTSSECPEKPVFIEKNVLILTFKEVLLNAIKYTKDGMVDIYAKFYYSEPDASNYIRVDVVDYGVGIEEEALKYIFNEFYHHDFVNVYRDGDRITIPMCKQMLVNSGGDLLVESNIGQGTKVSIILPVYKD